MWNHQFLKRIDFRFILIISALMAISLLVISSTTADQHEIENDIFFTSYVKNQLQWFVIGWVIYFFFAGLDYRKLREWTWFFYIAILLILIGLFFVPSIQNVHRWYRILGFTFQPSEYAKLVLVMTLSWFLEYKGNRAKYPIAALQGILIFLIPFFLILKQPDLGTALVLFPVALVMFYLGGIKKAIVLTMTGTAVAGLIFSSSIFLGFLSHETLRPYITKIIKDYQYERLNPDTYHQKAAQTAIALGGLTGEGWRKSEFTGKQWLPAAHTDSVFPAFAEEFGLLGIILLLGIFFALVYCGFQVTTIARDRFGCLLSAGITVYLAVHILINLGMMIGFLPITGVPLILISYGGSSVLATMTALGILQSIYTRRFTF
ncbi:MAG: FtsW/RodA/SpoVE family cell cycle protein [Chlamydiae bacterium]|nr:FtsW/RodA/SpoVE family cell cycle protein [Chlamydiota bacterium]